VSAVPSPRVFSDEEKKLFEELALAVAVQLENRARRLQGRAVSEIAERVTKIEGEVAKLNMLIGRVAAAERRLDRIERFLKRYNYEPEG
jgi:GAF domain-containing protein